MSMNLKQLMQLYIDLAPRKPPILTTSGPGLGKTSIKRQLAAVLSEKTGKPWAYQPLVMTNHDPVEVGGFLVPRAQGADLISQFTTPFFWDQIGDADGVNKFAILDFDEITDAGVDAQKIYARAMLDRTVGTHRLPDGVWVLGSGNRRKDKSGSKALATMVQNRLMHIEVDYDMQVHLDHLMPKGLNAAALAFIRTNPGLIYKDEVPVDPGAFCSPRSFEEGVLDLECLAQSRGLTDGMLLPRGVATAADDGKSAARQNEHYKLAYDAFSGRVGAGAATQFFVHLKYADQLPTMDEIATNPEKAKVPEELGGQFQISYTIAQTAKEKQLPAVVKYFQRVAVEFQVVIMKGLIDRQHKDGSMPSLMSTPGVAQWITKHRDVIAMSA